MSRAEELLNQGSFYELRKALDSKELTSLELTQTSLQRAARSNTRHNSYISFCEEKAILAAKFADERISQGKQEPLTGIPVAIKDSILVEGLACTAASKMLESFKAPYNATVVTKLESKGAVIIGKTNLDEFAMGSTNENSFFGPVKNPWNLKAVPGGSSGGSAATVASRDTLLSLGSDTGGSIRQPSSFCGVTGLKPTYGRVSRYGLIAFASSLDQIGPLSSDTLGNAALLDALSGYDSFDATSSQQEETSFYSATQKFLKAPSLKGVKIGIPKEYLEYEINPEVKKVVDETISFFKNEGAQTVEVSLPHSKFALSTYYLICTSECSSNLARYDGIHIGRRSTKENLSLQALYEQSRAEGFGDEVRLRILLGTFALSSGYYDAYFKKAAQVRRLIKNDFDSAFKKVNVILGPTAPTTAFKIGKKVQNPIETYLNDVFTLPANLAGIPGISFNAGFDKSKLPIGVQILSPMWNEEALLKLSSSFEMKNPTSREKAPQ